MRRGDPKEFTLVTARFPLGDLFAILNGRVKNIAGTTPWLETAKMVMSW